MCVGACMWVRVYVRVCIYACMYICMREYERMRVYDRTSPELTSWQSLYVVQSLAIVE